MAYPGLMQLNLAYLQVHYELDAPKIVRTWFALSIQSARKPFGLAIVVQKAAATMISGHNLPALPPQGVNDPRTKDLKARTRLLSPKILKRAFGTDPGDGLANSTR